MFQLPWVGEARVRLWMLRPRASLFLPNNSDEWLTHTSDQLVIKKCAYWVSLSGAPETTNRTGTTVHIPLNQTFNIKTIQSIFNRLSDGEALEYEAPV